VAGREHAEFSDPRLVPLYDTVCAYAPGTQPDWYAGLADRLDARTIVDLGCGTGLLTAGLARPDRHVVGVEPSAPMLRVARERVTAGPITWVHGNASALSSLDVQADLATMTGHVAQLIVDERAWRDTLAALHSALRPGGTLAFESRNPEAAEWDQWTADQYHHLVDSVAGPLQVWSDGVVVEGDLVRYRNHVLVEQTGEHLISDMTLRFRPLDRLEADLSAADFEVESVHGDWDARPAGPAERELILTAIAR
jgi:ubiquinone/menaquinone biosynthesis C-methylase UbiE